MLKDFRKKNDSVVQKLKKTHKIEIKLKRKAKLLTIKGVETESATENMENNIFLVGMEKEDEIVVDSYGIKSFKASLGNEMKFESIPFLKDQFLAALETAKDCMMNDDMCVMSIEVCDTYWKESGIYKSENAQRYHIRYRQFSENYLQKLKESYVLIQHQPVRHDLQIKLNKTNDVITYRKYISRGHDAGFSEEEEDYQRIELASGYVLYPVKEKTCLHIFNPSVEKTLKIYIKVYSSASSEYESIIRGYEQPLVEFFEKISLESKDTLIPPPGFSMVKFHESQKSFFALPDGNEFCIERCRRIDQAERSFIRVTYVNKNLVAKLKERKWNKIEIASMLDETLLLLGNHLMLED